MLSELDPSIRRNFVSRNWVSLCELFDPPPTTLIREFYYNLSIYSEVTGGHYLTSCIRGQEFTITKKIVSEALEVPLVHKPTYLYTVFTTINDMMSLLCGHPVSWGSEPRINYIESTKLNSLYLSITCHNMYPISHIHIFPIERCAFLYAFITEWFYVFSVHVYKNHC